jgi:hypothetical protein
MADTLKGAVAGLDEGFSIGLDDLTPASSFTVTLDAQSDGVPIVRPPYPIYDPRSRNQGGRQGSFIDSHRGSRSFAPSPHIIPCEEPIMNRESHSVQQDELTAPQRTCET